MRSRQTVLRSGSRYISRCRLAALAAGCALLAAQGVAAAACPTLPYTLQNGQTADATQVMGDFNGIVSCPLFTGNVGIGVTSAPYGLTNYNNSLGPLGDWANNYLSPSGLAWAVTTNNDYAAMLGNFSTTGLGVDVFTNATGTQRLFTLTNGGRDVDVVLANGDFGIGTTSPTANLYVNGSTFSTTGWSTASDGRLKRNIEPIGGALSLVQRLQGVRFEFLPADQRTVGQALALPTATPQVGFVAQAVQKVVPEAVSAPEPGADGIYSLDSSKLVPILVEAIKEQQAEIEALKAQVAKLGRKTP